MLLLDVERVGDAVDVVEIGGDLGSVVDGAVVEADGAQLRDVGFPHLGERVGELFGKRTEGGVGQRQLGLAPVGGDLVDKTVRRGLVGELEVTDDLGTEVVSVSPRSVDAAVSSRDDHGD